MRRARLLRDSRGGSTVEYLVLIGLIAVVGLAGAKVFGGNVKRVADGHSARVLSLEGADGEPISVKAALAGNAPARGGDHALPPTPQALPPPPPSAPATAPIEKHVDDFKNLAGGKDFREVIIGGEIAMLSFDAKLSVDSDGDPHVRRTTAAAKAMAKKDPDHEWRVDPDWQSSTSLSFITHETITVKGKKGKTHEKDVTHVVPTNAREIPFIALPPGIYHDAKAGTGFVHPGDLVRVTYNGKTVYAVYADGGPPDKIGEASEKVAKSLGFDDDPRNGGTTEAVVHYEVLPGSGAGINGGAPMTYDDIQARGQAAFAEAVKKGIVKK